MKKQNIKSVQFYKTNRYLSSLIKKAILKAGNPYRLARKLNIHCSVVYNWRNGVKYIHIDNYNKIERFISIKTLYK